MVNAVAKRCSSNGFRKMNDFKLVNAYFQMIILPVAARAPSQGAVSCRDETVSRRPGDPGA